MINFKKDDETKPEMAYLPWSALVEVCKIMDYGARKYGRDNWKTCDDPARYTSALLRHLAAHQHGEILDPESGYSHLAHMACNSLFLLWLNLNKK